jgi:aldose 1-epimerase
MLELASGAMRMLLCPETGGAVARLSWAGKELLRPVSEDDIASGNARRLGMFPLAPYSNRIADGMLVLGQEAWPLRHNCAGEAHSMHGFAWQRPWTVAHHDSRSATLILDHEPNADWPFRCRVKQRLTLHEDGLHVQLMLANDGGTPMPGGLGFHPYFVRTSETRLQVDWAGRWEMDERKLPSSWMPLSDRDDFRDGRAIGNWHSDHCYTGWTGSATLDYDSHRVTVSSDADCSRLVCFVPDDGRMLVALEPVTHVNNAFALAHADEPDTGMRLLQPGECMTLAMLIKVEGAR